MRKVADHLGVGAMSLYTYVPGKAELIDLMLDTVLQGGPSHRRDAGRAGGPGVEHVARRQPGPVPPPPVAPAGRRQPPAAGPRTLGKYDHELSALEGTGLTDLEMDNVLTLIAAYVHGAARGVVEAERAAQETGMTDAEWWTAHEPFLVAVGDFSAYPLAGRVGTASGEAYNAAGDPAGSFEFGLARLLDGIAVPGRGPLRPAPAPPATTMSSALPSWAGDLVGHTLEKVGQRLPGPPGQGRHEAFGRGVHAGAGGLDQAVGEHHQQRARGQQTARLGAGRRRSSGSRVGKNMMSWAVSSSVRPPGWTKIGGG